MTRIATILSTATLTLFTLMGLLSPSFAAAQTVSYSAQGCLNFGVNLSRGATDASSGGEVTPLQVFLQQEGVFPYQPVGVFGPLTFTAVTQLQANNGIPATGFVGPLTRAFIARVTCSGGGTGTTSSAPNIQSLSTYSAPAGAQVTIYGSGFNNQNVVLINNSQAASVASNNGQTITFIVPQSLTANCFQQTVCPQWAQLLSPGTYSLAVENVGGTSNTLSFTISGGISTYPTQQPIIQSVFPSVASVGNVVNIYGSGFTSSGNTIYLNNQVVSQVSSSNGQTLSFVLPTYYGANCSNNVCSNALLPLANGTYNLSVSNSNGASNTTSFVVEGNGQIIGTLQPSIQSLSAYSASTGATVTIFGSGFSSSNTIYLNNQAITQAASSDGQTLSFVLPNSYSANCSINGPCSNSFQTISSGTYNLSVGNTNGTSNSVSFTVNNTNIGQVSTFPITINISASTNTYPLSLLINTDGSGQLTINNATTPYATNTFPYQTLLNDIAALPAYSYGNQGCAKSASFGTTETITYNGQVSGDLECPPSGQAYTTLTTEVNSVINQVCSGSCTSPGTVSQTSVPSIQSIAPTSADIGTTVTVSGAGFALNANNTIYLNNQAIAQVVASSNSALSFTLPSAFSPNCSANACSNAVQPIGSGTYTLTVGNANGTSNGVSFSVIANSQRFTQ